MGQSTNNTGGNDTELPPETTSPSKEDPDLVSGDLTFEEMVFELSKYINRRNITTSSSAHPLLQDATAIDPGYAQDLLREVESLRGGVAVMVAHMRQTRVMQFFMYFVRRFEKIASDFLQLLYPSGKSHLTETQIRTHLGKLQRVYVKVLAIYEVSVSEDYPKYDLIEKFLIGRKDLMLKVKNITEEYDKHDKLNLEPSDKFQTQLTEFLYFINLTIIRELYSYLVIYKFTISNPSTCRYITDSIARALFLVMEIQERLDVSSKTVYMKPADLFLKLFSLFSELKIFLNFTKKFTAEHERRKIFRVEVPEYPILDPDTQEPKGQIELFTSRKCDVCQAFFNSELWTFFEKLASKMQLRIKIYDIYFPTAESWAKGVYELANVPTIVFGDKAYWINPSVEPNNPDPHATIKRELLNFFEVLGLKKSKFFQTHRLQRSKTR